MSRNPVGLSEAILPSQRISPSNLPPPNQRLLNLYGSGDLRFPRPNLALPPPPSRYQLPYNVRTGQGINRSNRALPPPPRRETPKQPSNLLETIKSLPAEVQLEFLSKFSYDKLQHICKTDKYFASLCEDELLWKTLYKNRFTTYSLDESWKQSYIHEHETELVKPILTSIGLPNFLNLFVPELIKFMVVNAEIADQYRFPLTQGEIEKIEGGYETPISIYSRYFNKLNFYSTSPDPYKLYAFKLKNPLRRRQNILISLDDILEEGYYILNSDQMYVLESLVNKLRDPKNLMKFLHSPIPGLQNVKIHNTQGVNWNPRSLIDARSGLPNLNILETGEEFMYTINKPKISLLDILIGIMSVKPSKENFHDDQLVRVVFDQNQNVIYPEFDFES